MTQDETRRRAELQQLTQQAQTTFQSAQAKLQAELRGQLAPILADIAKRYGADFVLNSTLPSPGRRRAPTRPTRCCGG